MLSQNIARTIEALKEAQIDGTTIDLSEQAALLKVMAHWQALAIQLECKPAPSGRVTWRPEIVAGTDFARQQNDQRSPEVLANG